MFLYMQVIMIDSDNDMQEVRVQAPCFYLLGAT